MPWWIQECEISHVFPVCSPPQPSPDPSLWFLFMNHPFRLGIFWVQKRHLVARI